MLLAAACASPKFPAGLAGRSITMPKGHHQVSITAGHTDRPSALPTTQLTPFQLLYRVGLSDSLEYRLPIQVAYRFGDRAQVSVGGGLTGIGSEERSLRPETGDPRVPNDVVQRAVWDLGARVGARVPIHPIVGLVAYGFFDQDLFGSDAHDTEGGGGAALVVDPTSWLSFAIHVGGGGYHVFSKDRTAGMIWIGGLATDGYGPIPTLAVHLTDTVTIFGTTGIGYDTFRGSTFFSAFGGFDYHFATGVDADDD